MQYIIFGCGTTGKLALKFLGYYRVACFSSNHPLDSEGYNRVVDGKSVVSFEEMLHFSQQNESVIVVASEKYAYEMGLQLREAGITRFFVFQGSDVHSILPVYPGYWLNQSWEVRTYNKILSLYHIENYKRIAVYGDNPFLPYLISEIAFQNSIDSIIGIVQTSDVPHARSVGLPVVSYEEVKEDIDCLVINTRRSENPIHDLLDVSEHGFDIVDIYDIEKFEPAFCHPELSVYKGIHKDKRIFLIGNGPSLRIEDLDTLHKYGEICFGFNQVVRAYDRTKWRATYLGITDLVILKDMWELIPDIDSDIFFVDTQFNESNRWNAKNIKKIHMVYDAPYPNGAGFSSDITLGVYNGYTSVYNIGMQLSVYMGAKEVILLGMDNEYSSKNSDEANHFLDCFFIKEETKREIDKIRNMDVERNTVYEKAEKYSRSHGFRIYNATRGGKLEAFERVDFDSLFDSE